MISVIDNMGNTNKTVIHTPKLRTSQQLFMSNQILFKNLINLQQILEIKKNFYLNKKPKRSKFENSMSKKKSETKMLNRQNGHTS